MKYFSRNFDHEFELHATAEEARAAAEKSLSDALEDGLWHEDTQSICWGELRQHVVAVKVVPRCQVEDCEEGFGGTKPCDGGHHERDYDDQIDYQLCDVG